MENRITSISIIRVLAMFSIILGHYLSMKGIYTYQLLSIGVEIFLLISGYLYGGVETVNGKLFFLGRFKRIILPFWITLFFNTSIRLIAGFKIQCAGVLVCLLNLQGVGNIFININAQGVDGLGHAWFITVIVICYIIMYFLKKAASFEKTVIQNWKVYLCIAIIFQIGLAYLGIQISYFIEFFVGYFYAKSGTENSAKLIKPVTAITAVLGIVRIFSWKIIDGTILYDCIIARLSFNALAIWIVLVQSFICTKYKTFWDKTSETKLWKLLDIMSYPMFLCHFMFCSKDLSVARWCDGTILQIVLFIVLTISVSLFVVFFSNRKKIVNIFR